MDITIVGKKIMNIRPMTKKEYGEMGWEGHHPVMVLILEDGTLLYPSSDYEGNSGGALFGRKENDHFTVYVK
jgi:hypothetical protein